MKPLRKRIIDALKVLVGAEDLQRSYQNGLDDGTRREYIRLITNKAYIGEVKAARAK